MSAGGPGSKARTDGTLPLPSDRANPPDPVMIESDICLR